MKGELTGASKTLWSTLTHAHHRHSSEEWFERYAGELLALLPTGGSLLDVGCGACEMTTYLAPHFSRVVAVDFSPSMLAASQERIESRGVRNITLSEADAVDLRACDGRFDVILAYSVLQYLDSDALARHLTECERLLAPGGVVCWGHIPNARLRWMCHLGLLTNRAPGLFELAKRAWHLWRRYRTGSQMQNPLWDGIGRWYDPSEVHAAAESAGMIAEVRQHWYYEYRMLALLRRNDGNPPAS